MTLAQQLAKISLEIGAIQINPKNPFTWASGYRMPIYNDNRKLLGHADHRALVAKGLQEIIDRENLEIDTIAGVATAGIPHATSLANLMKVPLIYVRSSAKEHGLKNQIEGILNTGHRVGVVEDLISTGGSAIKAVQAVREAGGVVEHCFGIFSYGFEEAERQFQQSQCRLHTLMNLKTLLQVAVEENHIGTGDRQALDAWMQNPFEWGENQ